MDTATLSPPMSSSPLWACVVQSIISCSNFYFSFLLLLKYFRIIFTKSYPCNLWSEPVWYSRSNLYLVFTKCNWSLIIVFQLYFKIISRILSHVEISALNLRGTVDHFLLQTFTFQLIKLREGNLVLTLPNVRYSRNFHQIIFNKKWVKTHNLAINDKETGKWSFFEGILTYFFHWLRPFLCSKRAFLVFCS